MFHYCEIGDIRRIKHPKFFAKDEYSQDVYLVVIYLLSPITLILFLIEKYPLRCKGFPVNILKALVC